MKTVWMKEENMVGITALSLLIEKPIVNTWREKKSVLLCLVVYQVSKRLLSKALFCTLRTVSIFSLWAILSEGKENETSSQDLRFNTWAVYFCWSETSRFLGLCFNWCTSLTSWRSDVKNPVSISVKRVHHLPFPKPTESQVLPLSSVDKFLNWLVLFLIKERRNSSVDIFLSLFIKACSQPWKNRQSFKQHFCLIMTKSVQEILKQF